MTTPQNDPMKDALTDKAKIEQLEERLKITAQLLTVAIAKLGGEIAVTTTEIERSTMGQNIALTPLPNDRGYYAALVTIDMPGGVG
jgi:hypothetical protein